MKTLFLVYHGFSDISGISKKILAQIKGLQECGHEVHCCTYSIREDGHRCRFVDNEVISDYGSGKLAPVKKRICYGDIYNYCIKNNIEFVYARSFHNANPFTIRLFSRLKKAGIKCVMEIPTYPYDQEYIGMDFRQKIGLCIDKIFRNSLARQFESIVTFSDAEEIFSCRTIRISNGIDFDSIPIRKEHTPKENEIHMLGVAEVHYWHAFDRLIKGLGEYYKVPREMKAYFHIVGGVSANDFTEWSKYIKEYGLKDYVIFHGQQSGDKLTESFDNADFGIGSLGRHRSGIDKIKTLKNREYAARGIPFIYSETDSDFEDKPYIIKAPANESPIDIERIIDFWKNLNLKPTDIRNSILSLSWKEQMQIVVKSLG